MFARNKFKKLFVEQYAWYYPIFNTQRYYLYYSCKWDFLMAQMVKNLPAVQETRLQSLGWENPLEKGMAIHSSILAWRLPWTEEPGGYSPWGRKKSDTTEQLTHTQL